MTTSFCCWGSNISEQLGQFAADYLQSWNVFQYFHYTIQHAKVYDVRDKMFLISQLNHTAISLQINTGFMKR